MKKGAILAVSLGFIALLSSLIYLFVELSSKTKEEQNRQYTILQMGSLLGNLSDYLKSTTIDNEMLFYASKTILPIKIGSIQLTLHLESTHNKVSINHLLQGIILQKTSKEPNTEIEDRLLAFLQDYRLNNPMFLIDLLLDSFDNDDYARSHKSEIIEKNEAFYNGRIDSIEHLNEILNYYALNQNDIQVYNIPWDSIFSFDYISGVDLNHASIEVLQFLFPNVNVFTLQEIARHEKWYEEVEDLPFNSQHKKTIIGKHFGIDVDIKSTTLQATFNAEYNDYNGKIIFKKTMGKNSRIFDIQLLDE